MDDGPRTLLIGGTFLAVATIGVLVWSLIFAPHMWPASLAIGDWALLYLIFGAAIHIDDRAREREQEERHQRYLKAITRYRP